MKKSPDLSEKIKKILPECGCIVDIGCGDADFLQSLTGQGYNLVGIDPAMSFSDSMEKTDLLLLNGSAEAIPLSDHFADVIIMQCVFSLCNEKETVCELKRVLKPGGMLIVTDLFSGTNSVLMNLTAHDGLPPRIKRLSTKEDFERCFLSEFSLLSFSDEKQALIQMLIEAIFNDNEFCISFEEQEELKKYKVDYGMWIFT